MSNRFSGKNVTQAEPEIACVTCMRWTSRELFGLHRYFFSKRMGKRHMSRSAMRFDHSASRLVAALAP